MSMIRCKHCEKEFNTLEGYDQHIRAKHAEHQSYFTAHRKKQLRIWSIIGLVLIFILGTAYSLINKDFIDKDSESQDHLTNPIPDYPIHWHPELTIIINGETYPIPANIGLTPGSHSPVHTHETNGTIHLENNYPSQKNMQLGYFFDLWNKDFTSECIFDYCVTDGRLTMTVNGIENTLFDNYVIADGDIIVIIYISNTQTVSSQNVSSSIQNLSASEAADFLERKDELGLFVLNVHTPYEGELEGTDALIEDWEHIAAYVDQLPEDKDTPLFVYCRTGRMSSSAVQQLQDLGYTTLYHLEGGMRAWQEQGFPLVNALEK